MIGHGIAHDQLTARLGQGGMAAAPDDWKRWPGLMKGLTDGFSKSARGDRYSKITERAVA
jgi:hypothetical protein